MIINGTYFVGDIYLSQVGDSASSIVNNNEVLQNFIDEYEPDILIKALGRKLYNEFSNQLEDDGTLKPGVDQKWNDLLEGKEYVVGDITYYWKGLVTTVGSLKKSLMAYYVFYWYVKKGLTQSTTLGTVKASSQNSEPANATPEMTQAWRKLYEWYGGADHGHSALRYSYKGVQVEDYFGADNSKEVSLYTFLLDNESNYDHWYFTPIENKNEWGL